MPISVPEAIPTRQYRAGMAPEGVRETVQWRLR
jgi:hypothetical protein